MVFSEFQERTLIPGVPIPLLACSILTVLLLAGPAGCHQEPTAAEATTRLQEAFPEATRTDAVRVAIEAAKANDYAAGVVALEAAKTSPGLSGAQLAAMEQARQTITADLVRRADAGDATAKAQLAAIEKTRSQ